VCGLSGLQIVHCIKLHIFMNADTRELVCRPFPCLNKVMAVSPGGEVKKRDKWRME
jgi:hypothetical protein